MNIVLKNHVYVICIAFTCISSLSFAQGEIMRASLSTALVSENNTNDLGYMVQHSVGHMGIIGTVDQRNHTVMRGFLLPQEAERDTAVELNWSIYPVPFDDEITIEFDKAVSGNLIVRLYDVAGKIVAEKYDDAAQKQQIQFDYLAPGEYLIMVEVMGNTFSRQILRTNKTEENKSKH